MSNSSYGGRNNGKKTIYSSKADVRDTRGVYLNEGRDKRRRLKFNKQRRRLQQLKIVGIVLIVVALIGGIMFATRKNAVNVYSGENYIGMIKGAKVSAEDLTKSITAQLASEIGTNVLLNEEIRFEKVRAKKKELVTTEYVLSEIKRLATYKVEAAVITVDGAGVLSLPTADDAKQVLDGIMAEYVPAGSNIVETGFVENVQTVTKFVDSKQIVTIDEARAKLTDGTSAVRTYTVATGDTLSKIAAKNDVSIEEILQSNPGMTVNTKLRIGEKLNLKVMVPFISVKTAENTVFTEKQDKLVEYRKDNNKPSSYKKVIQQGKDGQKEVTTQIIRVNGFETEQKVVSEKTTVEPVTEIIVVGTK